MCRSSLLAGLFILAGTLSAPQARADRPSIRVPGGSPARGSKMSGPPRHAGDHSGYRYRYPGRGSSVSLYLGVGPRFVAPYGCGYGYPYSSWNYGYYSPYGVFYDSATNRAQYYLPPVYAPAELNYGPLANERFFGIRRTPVAPPARTVVPPAEAPAKEPEPRIVPRDVKAMEIAAKLRKSNAAARRRAALFIAIGNTRFREQRFHEALQRYKSAIEAAPDLADTYRREGFALIAVNQYRLAAKAFKIAVHLDPAIATDAFRLDDMYGDSGMARAAHLETLARSALASSDDADLLFLVGVFLSANGESERARKFFVRVSDLVGKETVYLKPYLDAAPHKALGDKADRFALET